MMTVCHTISSPRARMVIGRHDEAMTARCSTSLGCSVSLAQGHGRFGRSHRRLGFALYAVDFFLHLFWSDGLIHGGLLLASFMNQTSTL